ncbi:MAG: hypothetical protein P1P76_05790 [Anaerolineales bacterium]|nr:hypothetical protein [Anaerolineales bacterium]
MADADQLLAIARDRLNTVPEGSEEEREIRAAAELLTQLLAQDIERDQAEEDEEDEGPGGPRLKRSVSKARIVYVHDPEMRHRHKSRSNRFEGHKLSIAVEPESQLITGWTCLRATHPTTRVRWNWLSKANPTQASGSRKRLRSALLVTGQPGRSLSRRDASSWPGCPNGPTGGFSRKRSRLTWRP